MYQLKQDSLIAKLYSRDFMLLEKELPVKYKNLRNPQTKCFRLDYKHIGEIK